MDPRFSAFDVSTHVYKTVKGHRITADILVPKGLTGKAPIIARFHGGFLVTSTSLYPDWFPPWLLELATETSAVIVSANYRLIPESTGLDMLEDVDDFWKWVSSDLVEIAKKERNIQPDLERLAVMGESAGGYLAMISALEHGTRIHAGILAYPVLDLNSKFFTVACEKNMDGLPNLPASFLTDYLENMDPNTIVSEATSPEQLNLRLDLGRALVQQGIYTSRMGTDPRLFPVERVRGGERVIPALWIFHGDADSSVPVDGTRALVEALKGIQPDARLILTIQSGAEHGWDNRPDLALAPARLEDKWMHQGITFVKKAWLGEA